jgi:protease II
VQDPSSSALVVHEYDEWGHTDGPDSKEVLEYIRSYSPCENLLQSMKGRERTNHGTSSPSLGTGRIPAVLISVGLRDDKVSPEESFKWISLLRQQLSSLPMEPSLSVGPVLLHIQEHSGHEGSSSLTEQFYDQAVEIAFLESNTSSQRHTCVPGSDFFSSRRQDSRAK